MHVELKKCKDVNYKRSCVRCVKMTVVDSLLMAVGAKIKLGITKQKDKIVLTLQIFLVHFSSLLQLLHE